MRRRNIKRVFVKVIQPGRKTLRKIYRTKPGRVFTSDGIESCLQDVASELEKHGLADQYEVVQIGANEFNFVPRKGSAVTRAGQDEAA